MAYNSQNIFLRDNINGRPGEMRDLELLRYLGRTFLIKKIFGKNSIDYLQKTLQLGKINNTKVYHNTRCGYSSFSVLCVIKILILVKILTIQISRNIIGIIDKILRWEILWKKYHKLLCTHTNISDFILHLYVFGSVKEISKLTMLCTSISDMLLCTRTSSFWLKPSTKVCMSLNSISRYPLDLIPFEGGTPILDSWEPTTLFFNGERLPSQGELSCI